MNAWKRAAAAAFVLLAGAASAAAQSDFEWRGQLAPGQRIEIKGINGSIRAVAARGQEVEVKATRTARRSNPADVRFEVVPHAGGVIVCAMYPTPSGQPANECQAGTAGRMSSKDNDTVVDFTVAVPAGIGFTGRTVNGAVDGDSLNGDADGHTVNGSVRLITAGLASATTVNGSINVSVGRTDWPDGAEFKTVNGGITLKLPASASADVRAQWTNGSMHSDLPIAVSGKVEARRLQGTIGSGGRRLALTTVNGDITLLKQ